MPNTQFTFVIIISQGHSANALKSVFHGMKKEQMIEENEQKVILEKLRKQVRSTHSITEENWT